MSALCSPDLSRCVDGADGTRERLQMVVAGEAIHSLGGSTPVTEQIDRVGFGRASTRLLQRNADHGDLPDCH